MKLYFSNSKTPNIDYGYYGIIVDVVEDERKEQLKVIVELDDFPDETYIKYFKTNPAGLRYFKALCQELEVPFSGKMVDTDDLINLRVICDFTCKNGHFFIDNMSLEEKYPMEEEEDE